MSRKLALMRAAKTAATEKYSPGGWKKTHLAPKAITLAPVDLPFLPPPDSQREPLVHVLDWPVPPSDNRLYRSSKANTGNRKVKVYKSPVYETWINQASAATLLDNKLRGMKPITGPFSAIIKIRKPKQGGDIQNRGKAVLDLAQSLGFITNDRNCQWCRLEWSFEPLRGCRVTLREELPA